MTRRLALLVVMTAVALVAAACGGDAAGDTTTTVATLPPTTLAPTTSSSTTTSSTSTTFPADAALTPDSRVSTVGMGPVFVGMTLEEAEEAAGLRLIGEPDPEVSADCYFVEPEFGLEGVSFMVLQDLIARVDIRPPSTAATRSGVQIGATELELRDLFPGQIEDGSEYVVDGVALVFVPADEIDAAYRVIFEMGAGDVVSAYRAGRLPGVGFGEGCV